MRLATKLGDWILEKALGVNDVHAAPCERYIGACSYCNTSGRYVTCTSCYRDTCNGNRLLPGGCRTTQGLC